MKHFSALLAAGVLLSFVCAHAGPADYVYTPGIEYGEKEVEFKLGSQKKGDDPRESASSLGFGWGAREWWFTEISIKHKRENNEGTKLDAIEWENKFQLTETGKYPIDLGFLFEIERPRDHAEGWEVKWGPLMQTEFGKVQLNANLLFERNYRAAEPSDTSLLYQWQGKYRWMPQLEFGLQGFGEMGKWNDWAPREERVHKIGPAIFGKLPMGGAHSVKYNAAWLLGASQAAPDHTLRVQLEYEF